MGIKPSDAKRLWGRSGARCALCRQELSPVGESALLGEMAHIVAQSESGPRGSYPLPLAERDRYENLILVCPNDHALIDNSAGEWSVDRLQAEKLRHERWVQELLDKGAAIPVEIDSSRFREGRTAHWATESGSWMYVALTPLEVADDAIDPLDASLRNLLIESRLPRYLQSSLGVHPNSYTVQPSTHGLVAENFSRVSDGMGYRIEVFRNGHIEYVTCLSAFIDWCTEEVSSTRGLIRRDGLDDTRKVGCKRVLEYSYWADTLIAQLDVLRSLWERLPFNDMVLTATMLHIQETCLLLGGRPFYFIGGRAAEQAILTYSVVMPRSSTREDLAKVMLQRFVNYFGMTLPEVFDAQGRVCEPSWLG